MTGDVVTYVPSQGKIRAKLQRGDREVTLTATEERLFVELAADPGRALPRQMLMERVFPGLMTKSQDSSISEAKGRLHDVVGAIDLAILETQGAGYRLVNRPTVPEIVRKE